MTITVEKILLQMRALVDELNEDGITIPESEVATIETNGIEYIDMANQELYDILKIYNKFEYANKPAPNLLGLLSNFDMVEFVGTDQSYPKSGGVTGVKAYYFETDNDGAVVIEENTGGGWVALNTINITGITSLTGYKGLVTPTSDTTPVRMRFTGSTFYRHINRCLYSYPFKADAIPDYRPWVKVQMPADFGELDEIIDEHPSRQYENKANYKWEGFNNLYVNYYYEGNLRVIYKPIPTAITSKTDTITLQNPKAIQFIIYYAASRVATQENQKLVNFYEQKANELKFEANKKQPTGEETIKDVYMTHTYTGGGW